MRLVAWNCNMALHRKLDASHHIDYVFLPRIWVDLIREFSIGTFDDRCGARLSDHVRVAVDVALDERIPLTLPALRAGPRPLPQGERVQPRIPPSPLAGEGRGEGAVRS